MLNRNSAPIFFATGLSEGQGDKFLQLPVRVSKHKTQYGMITVTLIFYKKLRSFLHSYLANIAFYGIIFLGLLFFYCLLSTSHSFESNIKAIEHFV
ncbi:hypothetical protein ABID23_000883 [Bartonella silvatica]|uniref:Uncharacterized protein n=1 Tax=Bartonella silvatica TaxID=357760 RepID=A0ABV2HGV6_9HYPH